MKDSVKDEKKLQVWTLRNYLQVTHLDKSLRVYKNLSKLNKNRTIQLENEEKIWRYISPKEDICLLLIHEKMLKTPGL